MCTRELRICQLLCRTHTVHGTCSCTVLFLFLGHLLDCPIQWLVCRCNSIGINFFIAGTPLLFYINSLDSPDTSKIFISRIYKQLFHFLCSLSQFLATLFSLSCIYGSFSHFSFMSVLSFTVKICFDSDLCLWTTLPSPAS